MNTFNKFAVGCYQDQIVIAVPPKRAEPLSKDDALNLAAWLVVMADLTSEDLRAAVEEIEK